MKKLFLSLALSLIINFLSAQDSVMLRYMKTITAEELSAHVHTLASPQFEGRYTGSEGQRMAAEYIRNDFKGMGLESGPESKTQPYFQSFALDKCYWKEQQLTSGMIPFTPVEDFVFLSDPQTMDGTFPVVFAGFGLDDSAYSDYKDLDVNGKVVLAFSGEPRGRDGNYFISGEKKPSRQSYYFSKMITARDKGALGLVIVSGEEKDYRKYTHDMKDYLDDADINYPENKPPDTFFTAYFNPEAAAQLLDISVKDLDKAREKTEKEHRSMAGKFTGTLAARTSAECFPMNTENVIAIIEGTDLKSEAIVVVAHYDHLGKKDGKVYYGADDNASGTSALMEIAEAFASAGQDDLRPRRTVIFMAVTAEELGLLGSRYYSENPVVPFDSTYACVNIDMIGRVGEKYKKQPEYVAGGAFISEDILEIAKRNSEMAAPGLEFKMTYRQRVTGGSDHYYFATDSIPSLFYFEGIHKDYHEPGDTPDKILYSRMEGIVRGIFGTVWDLANRAENW